jgi:ABC-2 type transport system permease protein
MFNSVVKEQMLRYIIPYKYFDPMYIIQHGSYETLYVIITLVFVIGTTLASYRIYVKKDFLL